MTLSLSALCYTEMRVMCSLYEHVSVIIIITTFKYFMFVLQRRPSIEKFPSSRLMIMFSPKF